MHLELWDAIQDGRTLAEWRDHPGYPDRLAGAIAALRAGSLGTASGFRFPAACQSIASAWLCGGDARMAEVAARLGLPARLDPDGLFAAVRAGRGLMDEDGVVIDLGQTSAKVWSAAHGYRRVERGGRDFAAVLASALSDESPSSLVLALPCEIDSDALGPCSYFDRLALSALSALLPCPTLIANDADLAAASAIEVAGAITAPLLVLTLGHGVGAALVLP